MLGALALGLAVFMLAACSSEDLAPLSATVVSTAQVDTIEVEETSDSPPEVYVVVRGYLPDGCTKIDQVYQDVSNRVINVTITTKRDPDVECTLALKAYEEVVPLETYNLDDGMYTVIVNDVSTSFELSTAGVLR